MTEKVETLHAAGFLISEANGNLSRDNGVLITGQNLGAGTVLGKITLAGASETHAGNTGNGVMTIDVTNPVRQGARAGVYTATCIAAAANGGTFRVEDPDGNVMGDVEVGATFDDDIKFVIADGSADFIVGDKFLITVAAGSGKYKILTPAAQDGSQTAAGILLAPVDATSADQACAVVARVAEVNSNELTWPGGISAGDKAAAIAKLAAADVLVR
jgi:hypothetical protein